MKINFLNVLNRKSTSDEVAEQIVLLEAKQEEAAKEKEALRAISKELRQKKLCGEPVGENQIKEADARMEDATLNHEAIVESINKLKDRLRTALEEEKEGLKTEANRLNEEICKERRSCDEEFARMHARLLVFAQSYLGSVADAYMKDGRLFRFNSKTNHIFMIEKERAERALTHPTCFEKEIEKDNYHLRYREFDLDKEFEAKLEHHRKVKK